MLFIYMYVPINTYIYIASKHIYIYIIWINVMREPSAMEHSHQKWDELMRKMSQKGPPNTRDIFKGI